MLPFLSRATSKKFGPVLLTTVIPWSLVKQTELVVRDHLSTRAILVSTIQSCILVAVLVKAGPLNAAPADRLSWRSTGNSELLEMVASHRFTRPPRARSMT